MLRSFVLLAFLIGSSAGPALAQEKTPEKQQEKPPEKPVEKKESKDSLNQRAVQALTAKKYDEGISLLMKILESEPKDMGTAYNLACAHSLKGEVDKAFEWLGKAADWGWGTGSGQLVGSTASKSHLEMTKTDPDFENMRKDPRWEPMLERIGKVGGSKAAPAANPKAEAYAAKPASYVPEKLAGVKELPILIVLHDDGSTKDQVVAGRWKAVADELGFALLAPSGRVALGEDPAKGMAWFAKPEDYPTQYHAIDKAVTEAVGAFAKERPIDRQKTVLVGEGSGGLVALNIALAGPGLCKGVVTVDGKFDPELYAAKAPTAGQRGLKVELLVDATKTGKEGAPDAVVASRNKLLQTWGLPGEARVFSADPKDPDRKGLLVEAVRAVLAPAATTAAAPK